MNALLLITTLISLTIRELVGKIYTKKIDGGVHTYAVLAGLGTILFFFVTSGILNFQTGILPYAILFGVSYLLSGIYTLKALATGSLSLTALIINCALILPTLYGLIILKEQGSFFLYIGVALLFAALVLVNKSSEKTPVTGKWLLYVTIAFFAGGMCSIAQKAQQEAFGGAGKNELMILSLGIVIVTNLVLALLKERERIRLYAAKAVVTGFPGGIINGVINLFVMIMLGRMPTSTVFPLISGGGIILTHIVSRMFYKEKLSRRQTVGFIIGILSVIFLNL